MARIEAEAALRTLGEGAAGDDPARDLPCTLDRVTGAWLP
jgi:hypothetical protein